MGGCCYTAPQSPKIPQSQSSRLPSNIPLRTLPSRAAHDNSRGHGYDDRPGDHQAASLLGPRGDTPHHQRYPLDASESASESSWTDTGDIGDQHADDDPVRLQLPNEIEQELLSSVQRRSGRSGKKVRIHLPSPSRHDSHYRPSLIDKEAIEVPDIRVPPPSFGQRIVGAIMAGRSGAMYGLTGKLLLYVPLLLTH